MNRLRRLALVPLLSFVFAGAASGQITNAIKQAPDVAAHRQTIQSYVDTNVKVLAGADEEKRRDARERLVAGVISDGEASPVFLDFYAGALNKALLPLAKHEEMHVRLNAAVAAARVAQRANNARLAEVAVAFMNDKSPAVALWGVKAARHMLPSVVQQGEKNPLTPTMVQVAQRSVTAPIVVEVYDAFTMDVFDLSKKTPPATLKAVIPQMLRVFRNRIELYKLPSGPAEPAADNIAAEFLTYQPVWQQMSPAQRTEAMQAIADLLGYAGQHAEIMLPEERNALLPVFRRTGKALQVVGDDLRSKEIAEAAQNVQKISSQMDGPDITKRTAAVLDALKSTKEFAALKATPKLELLPPEEGAPPPTETATDGGGDRPGASNGGPGDSRNAPPGAPDARPAGAGRNPGTGPSNGAASGAGQPGEGQSAQSGAGKSGAGPSGGPPVPTRAPNAASPAPNAPR